MLRTCEIATPAGPLLAGAVPGALLMLAFMAGKGAAPVMRLLQRHGAELPAPAAGAIPAAEVLAQARRQADEYFSGERRTFSLPCLLLGTPFQRRVWEALKAIPYGATESYLSVARRAGCAPGAVRAVAQAVGANPLSVVVPCHRVVGADGSLTGYAGSLPVKQWLLRMEREAVHPSLPLM